MNWFKPTKFSLIPSTTCKVYNSHSSGESVNCHCSHFLIYIILFIIIQNKGNLQKNNWVNNIFSMFVNLKPNFVTIEFKGMPTNECHNLWAPNNLWSLPSVHLSMVSTLSTVIIKTLIVILNRNLSTHMLFAVYVKAFSEYGPHKVIRRVCETQLYWNT